MAYSAAPTRIPPLQPHFLRMSIRNLLNHTNLGPIIGKYHIASLW